EGSRWLRGAPSSSGLPSKATSGSPPVASMPISQRWRRFSPPETSEVQRVDVDADRGAAVPPALHQLPKIPLELPQAGPLDEPPLAVAPVGRAQDGVLASDRPEVGVDGAAVASHLDDQDLGGGRVAHGAAHLHLLFEELEGITPTERRHERLVGHGGLEHEPPSAPP